MRIGSTALGWLFGLSAAGASAGLDASSPTATPWARAGARGWSVCLEMEEEARSMRADGSAPNDRSVRRAWASRARQCPNVPAILVLAAEQAITASQPTTLASANQDDIESLVQDHRVNLRRALRWLDTALDEASALGREPPSGTRYLRAVVLLGLGRQEVADLALAKAVAQGDVPRWRGDRMAAIIALMRGDLTTALRAAHRSLRDAPRNDTAQIVMSRYVLALVLDRIGAPSESREQLSSLRRQYRHTQPSQAVEALLPVHERLYLRALFHQAADNEANARRLWELYLARPEPEEPERRLARRHLAELAPLPPVEPDPAIDEASSDPPAEDTVSWGLDGTSPSSVAPSRLRAGSQIGR